jgi:hypothetical protein
MGILQSIPMCSRGENKAAGEVAGDNADKNNNTLPAVAAVAAVVAQPHSSQSIANENADMSAAPPDATSTPKSHSHRDAAVRADPLPLNADLESSVESSDAEGRVIDGETTNSDSGLEQSSSDELELGPRRRPVSVAAGCNVTVDDEGVNEVTISLDDTDPEEEEDPVERPPEPTVPDERVETDEEEDLNLGPVHSKDTTAAISNLLSEMVGGGSRGEGR